MSNDVSVSIGVDIGGTFTDIVLALERKGQVALAWTKVSSTGPNPVNGVLNAVDKGLARIGAKAGSVTRFMHATTVGTNAVLEGKGAQIGILTTEGFEDTLEIGRQRRTQLYEVFLEPETPAFLCPRYRRRGIRERTAADGSVLIPLDQAQVKAQIEELLEDNVQSLAVCYLFSFQNPVHELCTREIARSFGGRLAVSLSHEANPVFREYERTCVTAFDAYLRPVMERYLSELIASLRKVGVGGSLQTMKSRGGLASVEGALQRPVTTMLSGLAAGVIGARFVARAAGVPNVITLDMGGTSADIAVVKEGKPLVSTRGGIGRFPLNIPMVDVQTIGAGGGSIAWLDAAGGLRVGPQSAGSDPGPACYMTGGQEATVTDASVVLGYLDPAYFVGGDIRLDVDSAWRAVERIAKPLGMTVPQAALGIHRIVSARMADAIRLASIKRGHDIREFTLMLFGGAGPVNGAALAAQLGMTRCLVPLAPGVLSALGLLVSDVEYDNANTFLSELSTTDFKRANDLLKQLDILGRGQLSGDGYNPDQCTVLYTADMRYTGQSSELEVEIPTPLYSRDLPLITERFEEKHEAVYGYAPPGAPVEFVNLRAVHVHSPQVDLIDSLMQSLSRSQSRAEASTQYRQCYFATEPVDTPVYHRNELVPGFQMKGPAIIQQEDTTTVVYPAWQVRVDGYGNLIMEVQ